MLNFYFGFERLNQDGTKLFRCKDYRKKAKCPSFFKIKNENISEKNFIHNHSGEEKECSKFLIKTNIKSSSIKKTPNIFDITASKLYINKITNEHKISNIPNFMTIKNSMYREINRKLPVEFNSLEELDYDTPFTKTKNNEKFMIYKSKK